MKKNISILSFTIFLLANFFALDCFAYGDETVSGRVTDVHNKPIKWVKVELWEKNGDLYESTRTNRHGEFKIDHSPCGPCYLEITPPLKKRLAQALVENIPGDDDRSVLVSLKRGFLLKGKVVHEGKGLKDLVVKVYSKEHANDHDARIYGGGAAVTGRRGGFEFVLTPGKKHVVVLNNKYPDLVKKYEASLSVSNDVSLEDIELPAK